MVQAPVLSAGEFVIVSSSNPSLIFASKTGDYRSGAHSGSGTTL